MVPAPLLHTLLGDWQRRDGIQAIWIACMLVLCTMSAGRVWHYCRSSLPHACSALSQLLSPLMILVLASWPMGENDSNSNSNQHHDIIYYCWKSLAIGLLYCHLTIKLIVYSMARQPLAVVQWDVLLPLMGAVWWTTTTVTTTNDDNDDDNHVHAHVLRVWQVLAAYAGYRLYAWSRAAIRQICQHLSIYLWSIEKRNQPSVPKKEE